MHKKFTEDPHAASDEIFRASQGRAAANGKKTFLPFIVITGSNKRNRCRYENEHTRYSEL